MAYPLAVGAASQTVDLPGGRFHYLSWGTEHPNHPGMLLLHGITSSALSWVRVGPALADRYRVYAIDMRGHGESARPPAGAYGLRQTADDAAAFIEALKLERPVVIGHSWGGATAMMLASGAESDQPVPALAHVILEDPAQAIGEGDLEARKVLFTKDIGRPAEDLRPEIASSSPGWTDADIEGKIHALQHVSREAVASVIDEAGSSGNLLPLLAKITAPTLLLRADGGLDTTMNEAAWEQARRYLPAHSRAVEIKGATHNIHRSRFEAFMQAVNDFLNQ
jgi:pimeloyl-ACP methyl ester carboxylesterase